MNEWQIAGAVLLVSLLPCGWICARRDVTDALPALQLASALASLALLAIANAEQRQPFADLAVVVAALSFVGSIALSRFVERNR
jgi:multicomponent Na+:H+ antiporter subunit F